MKSAQQRGRRPQCRLLWKAADYVGRAKNWKTERAPLLTAPMRTTKNPNDWARQSQTAGKQTKTR
ncbi:hypothetical protein PR003_g17771 [Phytophthora rubi]|uniref:Uncharacterized protein n=1 Tax=Phytophthora rubi TaxID=129364 RepID=A0A6A4EB89_9STRA|nr:hypothetical protein PR001_g27500 [Phytophthora rubi]KAE9320233.1 hypothetical protein PR003_g17771 [Phytophthora rubi]